MSAQEKDRKEQWILQIWEEAKELARDSRTNLFNTASSHNSGSLDAGFEQALQDELATGHQSG